MRNETLRSYIRDEAEALSPRELQQLQLTRLRAGIARVAQAVPFFSRKLTEAGITATAINSLDDLRRLPFTTKNDLREHYPFGLLAVPMKDVIRIHASSGTTGKPTVVAYTRKDIDLWSGLMARVYAAAGVTHDDVVQNSYGYGLFTGGIGFHYGAEAIEGATVIPVSSGNTRRQLMIMRDFGASVLCCTPSYALLIAEVAREEGVDIRSLSLKVGIFGAEPWSERMRDEIESRLGVVALNNYGLSEVIGPGVAVECTEKQGMHIFEDHFIPEIVDPATGEVLPAGWRDRRTDFYLRNKGSPAVDSLPHPRSDSLDAWETRLPAELP